MTLAAHLRDCARAPHKGIPAFRDAIAADPKLAAEAAAMLAGITDELAQRCYVTRRTRDHLQSVIGAARG